MVGLGFVVGLVARCFVERVGCCVRVGFVAVLVGCFVVGVLGWVVGFGGSVVLVRVGR